MRRLRPLLVTSLVFLFAARAEARRVPLVDGACDLSAVGITGATGMTLHPQLGLAIVDAVADDVFFVDDQCRTVTASFPAPNANPSGISFDPSTGEFVVVDSGADELYFVNAAGLQVGSCDLGVRGMTSPIGIAYLPSGNYAIVDNSADEVFVVDDSQRAAGPCGLVSQFDLAGIGITNAGDVLWSDTSASYQILDTSAQEVYYVSTGGAVLDQFDTAGSLLSPVALFEDEVGERTYLIDNSADDLVQLDVRGVSVQRCSTAAWGSTNPVGLGVSSANGRLLVTDSLLDQIAVVDPNTCAVAQTIGTAGGGATDPHDVAYLALTNEYVVADRANSELFFFDGTSGALTSRCDTESLGYPNPTGVDYLPGLDVLAVTTDSDNAWLIVDPSCTPIHVRSAASLDQGNNGNTPEGIAAHPGTGQFVVIDSTEDEVYLSSFEGTAGRNFDTTGLGSALPRDVAADPNDPDRLWIVDDTVDAVFRLDVPAVAVAPSISGRFTSPAATVWLWDRGDGRVTGTAVMGPSTLPVFGEFEGSSGSLAIGAVTPTGSVVAFPITVSADLGTINAPAPVGTLTRDY